VTFDVLRAFGIEASDVAIDGGSAVEVNGHRCNLGRTVLRPSCIYGIDYNFVKGPAFVSRVAK